MDTKSTEHSLILNKILEEDLLLNNANVALLQEFVRSWIHAAVRGDTFCEILQNWLKRVEQLHLQKKLNVGTCVVTIFILEVWLNSIDLDQDSRYDALLSRTFVHFHNIIVSACLKNDNEITSNNDAVIAFFRLHCCLSKKVKGVELIRKYNLWKPLLSFYFQNNRFNLFIQNSCTEYINNLLSAELPNELISFLEVLNMSIQCIKNAIENGHPLCDGVLFRSLRFVYLLLSKNLAKLDSDSLRLTSKRCLSLESYVRHLLILSKDETIVCNALKIFVLLRIFLAEVHHAENDDKLFQRLIATLHQLLTENERFNHYVPEIFRSRTEFTGESVRWKLGICSAYLQVRTISEYLTQLDISPAESMDLDPLIPKSKIFNNFFELYFAQLRKQNQVATIATNILKNLQDEKNSLDQDTRIHIIRSFSCILKVILNDARKPSDELSNFLRNVVHASSALVAAEAELIKNETMFSELLSTLMQITLADQQYSVIVRLSVFKLCFSILRKLGRITDENENLLRVVVVQGLNSPCWEIRDTVLEILCAILPVLCASKFLFADNEVSKSLLERLQDEESFVRASAYAILTTSISMDDRHTWKMYFDYHSLLDETTQRFQNETEGNVREKMIDFLVEGWREIKISDPSLLKIIYQTMHTASVNDLYPEVRRSGMTFWRSLIKVATFDHDDRSRRNVDDILEKLFYTGCLQAIVSGIEDEYDEEVRETASEALQILKSVRKSVNETGNESTTVPRNAQLLNELLAIADEADLLNARQFISNITFTSFDYLTLEKPTETGELDLSDLLKCLLISDEGAEVNQKDCY